MHKDEEEESYSIGIARGGSDRLNLLTNCNMSNAGDQGAYSVYTGQARSDIPWDVIHGRVHPSVRRIKAWAFVGCLQLAIVILGKGVEEIRACEFYGCTLLREIVIPPAIRVIERLTFNAYSGLTIVVLGKGLVEIEEYAFCNCTSLQRIVIPPLIRAIHEKAFNECLQLTNVCFCIEIEEFVSKEPMRDWWNHGVHERSLSTYCFLV
jgi:hypothetical protein